MPWFDREVAFMMQRMGWRYVGAPAVIVSTAAEIYFPPHMWQQGRLPSAQSRAADVALKARAAELGFFRN